MRGWVPDAILDAPKQGFELPVARWLRGELSDYAREVLLDRDSPREAGATSNRSGDCSTSTPPATAITARIWTLLMLEMWHREQPGLATADPYTSACTTA